MRDAFGGTFMIKLTLVFIIIYVSFMAVAISYAKAFRVKNGVINIVEQYQLSGSTDEATIAKIDEYLVKVGYNYSGKTYLQSYCQKQEESSELAHIWTNMGACIVPRESNEQRYYQVITFIYIELPFLNINMTVPVKGETKLIYNGL